MVAEHARFRFPLKNHLTQLFLGIDRVTRDIWHGQPRRWMVVHTVLFLEKIFIKNVGTLCPQLPRTVIMSACVFSGGLRLNC